MKNYSPIHSETGAWEGYKGHTHFKLVVRQAPNSNDYAYQLLINGRFQLSESRTGKKMSMFFGPFRFATDAFYAGYQKACDRLEALEINSQENSALILDKAA